VYHFKRAKDRGIGKIPIREGPKWQGKRFEMMNLGKNLGKKSQTSSGSRPGFNCPQPGVPDNGLEDSHAGGDSQKASSALRGRDKSEQFPTRLQAW